MQYEALKALSEVRFAKATDCLADAKCLLSNGSFKGAANRAYYAVFHAMRAVLAYDGIDMKHHSGIISEFRRLYIKTALIDKRHSQTISLLSDSRNNSDYDDFYIISKAEVIDYLELAEEFLAAISLFLSTK